MRFGIPVYIMLGAMCFAVVTRPSVSTTLSTQETFVENFEHARKYGLVGAAIGSAITVREILESRRKAKNNA
jgi:hypothetical protein